MGADEVRTFLTNLAADRRVAASTHRHALSGQLFLYRKVLGLDLPWLADIGRPREHRRLPVVLDAPEVVALMRHLPPDHLLVAQPLYGTGMRITEALRLRTKDVDFARRTPHTLRHSFATHLLQRGQDIRAVQPCSAMRTSARR